MFALVSLSLPADAETPKPEVQTPKPEVQTPKPEVQTPKPPVEVQTPKPKVMTQAFDEMGKIKVGQPLPAWAAFTAENKMIRFQSILQPAEGTPPKAVAINFFGTWCEPCNPGLKVIEQVVSETDGYTAVLIAVPPKLDKVPALLEDLGVKLLVVMDAHDKVTGRFGMDKTIPRTIVVGSDGAVRAILGIQGVDFKAVLESAMGGAQIPATPKKP